MDLVQVSTDALERQLVDDERLIGRLRARQLAVLSELDVRQVATADGSRSLSEWLAARMDISTDTAKTLVRTMRRMSDRSDLTSELARGGVTFDRVEALSRLSNREPDDLLLWTDVAGVHREAAKRVRITTETETRTAEDRFLVMQPSLDESWWKGWFGLDGYSGALVDKILAQAADDLPDDVEGDAGWRRATALVETLISDDPPEGQVTVIVDTEQAAPTGVRRG